LLPEGRAHTIARQQKEKNKRKALLARFRWSENRGKWATIDG
jgi:hypothetical protein